MQQEDSQQVVSDVAFFCQKMICRQCLSQMTDYRVYISYLLFKPYPFLLSQGQMQIYTQRLHQIEYSFSNPLLSALFFISFVALGKDSVLDMLSQYNHKVCTMALLNYKLYTLRRWFFPCVYWMLHELVLIRCYLCMRNMELTLSIKLLDYVGIYAFHMNIFGRHTFNEIRVNFDLKKLPSFNQFKREEIQELYYLWMNSQFLFFSLSTLLCQ